MHDSIANMLESNFAMIQHHKYSLSDIEGMIPWERRVYIEMLVNHVREENERQGNSSQFDPAQFKG